MNKLLLEKLTPILQSKGWKLAEDFKALLSPAEERFVIDPQSGRLMKEASLDAQNSMNRINKMGETIQKKQKKAADQYNRQVSKFNKETELFKKDSGLDFSLENWENLASGRNMSDKEKLIYMQEAFPRFVNTYEKLVREGLLGRKNNQWIGYFENSVVPNSKVLGWNDSYRQLDGNIGAMAHIIANSPQAKNKLFWNGILMGQGIPDFKKIDNSIIPAKQNFINGDQNFMKWFSSNIAGSGAYANPNKNKQFGLKLYALPIRPSLINSNYLDEMSLIKRLTPHPTSTSWNGQPNSPIHSFIESVPNKKIYISEGPLKDSLASTYNGFDTNGIFTVVSNEIPVKALFGGTGMYDISVENILKPFLKKGGKI